MIRRVLPDEMDSSFDVDSGGGKGSMRFLTQRSISSSWPTPTKETIMLHSDLLQFLSVFCDSEVRFLVVGGYAVMQYRTAHYERHRLVD